MQPIRFLIIVALLAVSSASLLIPVTASASVPAPQPAKTITGTGQVCNSEAVCVDFQLTFDPAGGLVTGSYSGVFIYHMNYAGLSEIVLTETETGELTGTFSGGDGGTVSGTLSYTTTNRVSVTNGGSAPQEDESGAYRPWTGVLKADGTGSGTIECCQEYSPSGYMLDNPWTITFSAQDFQAGLSAANPTTASTVPSAVPTSEPGGAIPTTVPAAASKGLPFCGSLIIMPFLLLLPKVLRR